LGAGVPVTLMTEITTAFESRRVELNLENRRNGPLICQ
jgi:hypothetical protein